MGAVNWDIFFGYSTERLLCHFITNLTFALAKLTVNIEWNRMEWGEHPMLVIQRQKVPTSYWNDGNIKTRWNDGNDGMVGNKHDKRAFYLHKHSSCLYIHGAKTCVCLRLFESLISITCHKYIFMRLGSNKNYII